MEWVLAELLRNPGVLKRLKDEIRGIVGCKPTVKEEDLKQMNYLKAAIKESTRLHPPGPFLVPRELVSETTIQGYHIPKKTRVFVNVWAIQRDHETWEAPEEFRPERFMGSSVDFKGHDFQLIPFGAGRRRCPGIGFAVPIYCCCWNLTRGRHYTRGDEGLQEQRQSAQGVLQDKLTPAGVASGKPSDGQVSKGE